MCVCTDKIKPCVCHRDLNTRNILVKGDLSCVLCDLGLAIKLNGSHYYTLEEEKDAETKSISDVSGKEYAVCVQQTTSKMLTFLKVIDYNITPG